MLDVNAIEVSEEAQTFTDRMYEVKVGDEVLFTCGLQINGMVQRHIYLWLEPVSLSSKHLRELRDSLWYFKGLRVFANVQNASKRDTRFAEFFGFKATAVHGNITLYERTF